MVLRNEQVRPLVVRILDDPVIASEDVIGWALVALVAGKPGYHISSNGNVAQVRAMLLRAAESLEEFENQETTNKS